MTHTSMREDAVGSVQEGEVVCNEGNSLGHLGWVGGTLVDAIGGSLGLGVFTQSEAGENAQAYRIEHEGKKVEIFAYVVIAEVGDLVVQGEEHGMGERFAFCPRLLPFLSMLDTRAEYGVELA